MPHMNGLEATQRIRAFTDPERAAVPIIAMSADVFEERRKEAAAGISAYVSKPFAVERLVAELSAQLAAPSRLKASPTAPSSPQC